MGEWPALDHFTGMPMADSSLSAYMPKCDRARFLEYVRLAVNNTDEALGRIPKLQAANSSIRDQALPIAGFDGWNLQIISLSRNSPQGMCSALVILYLGIRRWVPHQ